MNSPGTKPSPTHYAPIPTARLTEAYAKARARLLARQHPDGYWTGELSSSSLSTATAVCALSLVDRERFASLIAGGLRWLRDQQNSDGGWGDTVKSFSNISTTMLCRAALTIGHGDVPGEHDQNWRRAESYVERTCGGLDPRTLARAIRARYGQDRTFSVPILSCCALAGLNEWTEAPALPFELACLPSNAYKWINLPVVSYALPALIALGIVRHTRHRSRNPFVRQLRELAKPRALRKLEAIQPVNGGFLEATPLVSFVTMSLAGAGLTAHPVARKGVDFLLASVRPDGSWPIDTNLSTWVTTLAINALAEAGEHFGEAGERLRQWLVEQQYRTEHPFTAAAPGGWGWTPLPGAVPDADDTAGALVALRNLGLTAESGVAGQAGAKWLLDLQNSDGGWPTFCRGWGYLPFDRSSADITAHALRALQSLPVGTYSDRIERAIQSGMQFLDRSQRPDGSWVPLWFGNQSAPDDENPTYGTARVLAAYHDLNRQETVIARRGYQWLITSQNADGGWGGAPGLPSSVEETALAVEALLGCPQTAGSVRLPESLALGLRWLVERVEDDSFTSPSPIGFYFAKLWYFEQLYPVVFTVGALGRALRLSTEQVDHGSTSFSI